MSNQKVQPTFIADCHLGKLAKYLRLMGFDTLFFPQIDDDDLVLMAKKEDRVIITRDRELSQRKNASVFYLKPIDLKEQLLTMVEAFDLHDYKAPFSRCIVCNTLLEEVDKERIIDRLPEKVKHFFTYFEHCRTCDRIYWHGDHYRHMKQLLETILTPH